MSFDLPKVPTLKEVNALLRCAKAQIETQLTNDTVKPALNEQAVFARFLETSAKAEGFGIKDHLKYRYVEYVTAEGLWNRVKAFINLGGLGYFFSEKVDRSNKEALKKECQFYRQCCQVQQFYQKFTKRPDSENFKGLQNAYEAILKTGEGSTQHDQINTILNIHCAAKGSSVGSAILEQMATNELTSQGGFNSGSVLNIINGKKFLSHIGKLAEQGYRSKVSNDETEVYKKVNERTLIEQLDIQSVLANTSARGIFMCYARAYRGLEDSLKNKRFSENLCDTLVVPILPAQVEREIKRFNDLILEHVKNPSLTILTESLPSTFQTKEFTYELNEMARIYQAYQENSARLSELNSQVQKSESALEAATKELETEKTQLRDCTFDELRRLLGENIPHENLLSPEVCKKYKDLAQQSRKLRGERNDIKEKIGLERDKLTKILQGGLEGKANILMDEVDQAKKEQEETGTKYEKITTQQLEDIRSKKEDMDLERLKAAVEAAKKYSNAVETYNNKTKQLKETCDQIKEIKRKIRLLFPDENSTEKHELRIQLDQKNKERKDLKGFVIPLTHEEIRTIHKGTEQFGTKNVDFSNISEQLGDREWKCKTSSSTLSNQKDKYNKIIQQNKQNVESLKKFGFAFDENDQVTSFEYSGLNKDELKKIFSTTLEAKAGLIATTIKALQLVAIPNIDVRRVANIFKTKSPDVVQAPVVNNRLPSDNSKPPVHYLNVSNPVTTTNGKEEVIK